MRSITCTAKSTRTDARCLRNSNIRLSWAIRLGTGDRDVFVVETAGFNGRTRLDLMGHPQSEAMRITERFRRRDFGHLDVEMTFDDPKMYTKPFYHQGPSRPAARLYIFEMYCNENEKDRAHLQGQ